MKLYIFPVAPNPTRVRLYLAEKAAQGSEIEIEQIVVNLPQGEQKLPEHLQRNPLGKLPVLEFEDGRFLTESTAIIEYLEELHPENPMIGADPRERARTRELDRLADLGVLMAVARIVHATNSPLGLDPLPEVAADARAALPNSLRVLDTQLADERAFVAGDRPSIADCTLQAAFQFARFGKVEIPAEFEHIARWDGAYLDRDVAKSILVT